MSQRLEEEDIQKIITGIQTTFTEERAEEILKTTKRKVTSAKELILMSASKMTDKDGIEKFVFVMDGVGTLIMSPDEKGLYKIDRMDELIEKSLSVIFYGVVKHFTGKEWMP